MSEHYKGRIIDPRAYPLADGTGWSAEVYVAEDVDFATLDTQFIVKEKFPSKEAALEAGLVIGKGEVEKRIRSSEIQDLFEEANRLPATSQHGFGPSADVGLASDGQPTSVPRFKTPDDPFRS